VDNGREEFKWLGDMQHLNKVMAESINNTINGIPSNIEELFCCLSHDYSNEIVRIMQFCDKNVIHFYYMPRQFGEYSLHLDPQLYLGKSVFTNRREPSAKLGNRVIKRSFDIAVSSIISLCFLPFLPIIAIIIKIQSPGPIFFRQARTGLNGNTFQCLKFRSMHVNKDADTVQATENDQRKFAFGNFMRKSNIDEFPQFFNVLKGDMSIVGPRPHMLHHTEIYGSIIDKYMIRHFSKPGITGWAQVTGFRGETKELWQMEERIKRDIWYIENWSFWLDLRIIYLTAKSIIIHDKNAY
jgi:putative colanic acid biosysnthesis UDP-glucose lipid carrier transferase